MHTRGLRSCLAVLLSVAAFATASGLRDEMAMRESLLVKGPLLGHRWLEKTGRQNYLLSQAWEPTEDSGLQCVGRWSYGPSLKVSLRVTADDTVICLTRGSGASLIRFRSQDSVTLDLLGDVDFAGIPRRAVLSDTLVIAGIHSGGTGLEVHGVSEPASPHLLSRVPLPVVNDIAVNDTLVYVACEDDTLRIYNIADPRAPVRVGACRDSCDLYMSFADGYCYLVHVSGVNIVDVRSPSAPARAGRIGGSEPYAVHVRDTLCYVTTYEQGLHVYAVSNPASPRALGSLARPDAYDVSMAATCDTLLFTSFLDIINVASPASPRLVGTVGMPASSEWGIAVVPSLAYALVANYVDGVVVVDVTNPATPAVDTTAFAGGSAVDFSVDNGRAYLASHYSGMAILDVSNPARPTRLGGIDMVGDLPSCYSVAALDSFAFMHWYTVPQFKSVDVSDPAHPTLAGSVDAWNAPEDIVLRDSLAYVAEQNRFEIVNVARPREPVLVGSCVIGDMNSCGLALWDSFAYVAGTFAGLQIVNIARPESPQLVSSNPSSRASAWGVAVRDTFVYVPSFYDTLWVFSSANPESLRLLGGCSMGSGYVGYDVALAGDSLAVAATSRGLVLLGISNSAAPRRLGSCATPDDVRRVTYQAPFTYAACYSGGVVVAETSGLGVAEAGMSQHGGRAVCSLQPSVTRTTSSLDGQSGRSTVVTVYSAMGGVAEAGQTALLPLVIDVRTLTSGVYFVEVRMGAAREVLKLTKP
jgi:hypothetical protein